MFFSFARWFIAFMGMIELAAMPLCFAQNPTPPSPQEEHEPAAFAPQVLVEALQENTASLENRLKPLKARLESVNQVALSDTKALQDQKAKLAMLKATLAVEQLSLAYVEELLQAYWLQKGRIDAQERALRREVEALADELTNRTVAHATLEREMDTLRNIGLAEAGFAEIQKSYLLYLKPAQEEERLMHQLMHRLQGQWYIVRQSKKTVDEMLSLLQALQETWRDELLKRQKPPSPMEQVSTTWKAFTDIPERTYERTLKTIKMGRIETALQDKLPVLIGLSVLVLLLGWVAGRVRRWLEMHLKLRPVQREKLTPQALLALGRAFLDALFPIGLTLWVALALWALDVITTDPARMMLYLLMSWVALRLLLSLIQAFFAGSEAGGILPLDRPMARFYRRSLKLLGAAIIFGTLSLLTADLFQFPVEIRQSLRYFLEIIYLAGTLWLLQRGRVEGFLSQLPVADKPSWFKGANFLRALLIVAIVFIILSELLGFHSLSLFLAEAVALTEGIIILWAFLTWLMEALLHLALHQEGGWLGRRYPHHSELIKRLYSLTRRVLWSLSALAALLAITMAWGVEPASLKRALRWLTWSIPIGNMQLTPLKLILAGLILWLAVWLSRFSRAMLNNRVFPWTTWDTGIQYTVATILHYLILALGVMLVINVLGLPLTNLALVAGALGVGIGLGLQNIVSNFISGLILLFERPIKVGDMLVIDGQWGEVKQIRIRSTLFRTYEGYFLIIPNSELLSSKIINWTHYGRGPSRITLKIRVSHQSDVQQVTEVLREVCRANPRVMQTPAPDISFQTYGDGALDFNIGVQVRTPDDRTPTIHELNSAIVEAFRKHGIETPVPQRDLHIKHLPETLRK